MVDRGELLVGAKHLVHIVGRAGEDERSADLAVKIASNQLLRHPSSDGWFRNSRLVSSVAVCGDRHPRARACAPAVDPRARSVTLPR